MHSRPYITGVGLVTPLGGSAPETWQALMEGRFIATHSRAKIEIAAGRCRVNDLALQVAREAIASAQWTDIDPENTAIVLATSKGAVETWIAGHGLGSFGVGDTAAELARALRWDHSIRCTLSAACASGLHALIRAAMMLKSHQVSRALVVAVESSLHPIFLGSFNRLGVLADEKTGCRPFDIARDGFLMSEAAAAICMELQPPARPFAAVENFALAGDATHLTGSDPKAETLRHLLKQVAANKPVDLVHAHGTGTITSDPLELAAIESILGSSTAPPNLYSHKGALGHSLGASGLVSIAINCLAHRESMIPPNVRTLQPLTINHLILSRGPLDRRITRSIAIASGFGGPTAAVGLISPQ